MKKLIVFLCCFATLSVSAKKLSSDKVPAPVKSAFSKMFSGAKDVSWEQESAGYEVNFTNKGTEMSAVFDASGAWKETETTIGQSELPNAAKDYIAGQAKGKKIKDAARIQAADGSITYEADVAGTDYIFSDAGVFIKTIKDEDGD